MTLRALMLLAMLATSGCAWRRAAPPATLPAATRMLRGTLVVHTDFYLPPRHRLVDELVDLRQEMHSTLGLPHGHRLVHVYLFDRKDKYLGYMRGRHEDFPDRRACFVEDDQQLQVFAFWGDRVAEDLRHEVAHGYLHASLGVLPLWLDEGVAEFYEVGRRRQGVNATHIDWLLQKRREDPLWSPDLARLERIVAPLDLRGGDYAESWLWVYWLLKDGSDTRSHLQNYMAALADPGPPQFSAFLQKHLPDHPDRIERFLTELLAQSE